MSTKNSFIECGSEPLVRKPRPTKARKKGKNKSQMGNPHLDDTKKERCNITNLDDLQFIM